MAAVGEPPPKWEEYPSRNGKLGHGNWMKLGGPSSDRSDEQQSEIPLIQASKLMKPQINPHIIYVDLNSIE